MPARLLHVTRDYPPRNNGGISRAVAGLVEAARARGVDSAVLSFDGWRKGAPVAHAPPRPGVYRAARGQLAEVEQALSDARPDALIVHDALLLEHLPKATPFALMLHVLQAEQSAIRGLTTPTKSELAERSAVHAAALVVAPSEAAAADARRHYMGCAIEAAPLGVDVAASEPAGEGALYAARFGDLKGTDTLIDAWPRVRGAATLTVAGGLPDHPRADRRWRARLTELPRLELAGWLEADALERAHRAAHVLVAPSRYETFSLSVAEALARGLRVVASDIGAHRELLALGETAAHFHAPGDPAALAAALEHALSSGPARVPARTLEELGWERRIDAHLRLWARL